jgi:hypothetical protein
MRFRNEFLYQSESLAASAGAASRFGSAVPVARASFLAVFPD